MSDPEPSLADAPLPAATLHLIRHGQTEWNVQRRVQGQVADIELTELGHRQAAAAAVLLAGSGARRVLSSDLTRAVQTAEPIAAALHVAVELEPGLREQRMGELEGRLSADVWRTHSNVDWRDPDHRFVRAESRREVYERMAATISSVAGLEPVVLVSHGDAIRLALAWLSSRPPRDVPWYDIPNCSITTVIVRDGELIDLDVATVDVI
jgi:probable phosphoglycerate mutase